MPRRRPGQVRAGLAVWRRCRKNELDPIRGLSRRTLYEIVRVEETRNYLWPGAVSESLRRWRSFVHEPNHRLWDPRYPGCTEWLCCGDPIRARENLEGAMQALPGQAGRELRVLVLALDERY
ncbi:hypothetical protein [Streptomyces lunaelactis]|uniref:hypothetical protein n=1 Tax=Streptomyces lunaelactis TaxID=1535768 RepID=UPI0020C7B2A3|nr:hypothetical protein [Streptomyces lunaelactis]